MAGLPLPPASLPQAPEIHLCPFKNESKGRQPDTTYSTAVDIWAMGVLAYEVLTGKPPFPNQHGEITHRQLMESDIRFPSWMSMDSVSFVKAALCKVRGGGIKAIQ